MFAHVARSAVLAIFLLAGAGAAVAQPPVAGAYCARGGHADYEKTPPALRPVIKTFFGIDDASLRDATFVRCVGPKLMACFIGANLACGKANTSRTLEGATEFCKDSPNADIVPYVSTGHDTVYEWSCKGRRAVAGKQTQAVDAQGYIAENWQEIR